MKCPHCGYVSFEYLDGCKKCSKDLSAHKAQFAIDYMQPVSLGILSYVGSGAAMAVAAGDESDSFDTNDFAMGTDSGVSVATGATDEFTLDFGGDDAEGDAVGGAVDFGEGDDDVAIEIGDEGTDDVSLDIGAAEAEDEISLDLGEDESIEEEAGISIDIGEADGKSGDIAIDFGDDDEDEIALDIAVDEPAQGDVDIAIDFGDDDEDEIALDIAVDEPAQGEADIAVDFGGDEDEIALDIAVDEPAREEADIAIDFGGDEDDIALDIAVDEPAREEADIAIDFGGDEDEIALDMGAPEVSLASPDQSSSSLNLDDTSGFSLDLGDEFADTGSGFSFDEGAAAGQALDLGDVEAISEDAGKAPHADDDFADIELSIEDEDLFGGKNAPAKKKGEATDLGLDTNLDLSDLNLDLGDDDLGIDFDDTDFK
jgi:hypothetical protein